MRHRQEEDLMVEEEVEEVEQVHLQVIQDTNAEHNWK